MPSQAMVPSIHGNANQQRCQTAAELVSSSPTTPTRKMRRSGTNVKPVSSLPSRGAKARVTRYSDSAVESAVFQTVPLTSPWCLCQSLLTLQARACGPSPLECQSTGGFFPTVLFGTDLHRQFLLNQALSCPFQEASKRLANHSTKNKQCSSKYICVFLFMGNYTCINIYIYIYIHTIWMETSTYILAPFLNFYGAFCC